ncbi:hypothetical protein VNO77_31418 [Canavalia gladiata]|uniref:Uncharacterized protein n=1 Tax=Canavalia gladiata TaxID=3824 RepID=A0AAN9KP64_CANGL
MAWQLTHGLGILKSQITYRGFRTHVLVTIKDYEAGSCAWLNIRWLERGFDGLEELRRGLMASDYEAGSWLNIRWLERGFDGLEELRRGMMARMRLGARLKGSWLGSLLTA